MRDRTFLDPWEPVRPESFFTLEAQRHRLARLREAEDLVDLGIFVEGGDELVGRIQLSGISPAPFGAGQHALNTELQSRANPP